MGAHGRVRCTSHAASRGHRPPCDAADVVAWEGGANDGALCGWVPRPLMAMTPQELSRFRSEQAKRLHAEGKFKPKNPGRKPNRPTAHQVIAERVRQEADEIAKRLIELAKDGKPQDSLRAIDSLLKSEAREQTREEREQDRLRSMSRDRLLAQVVGHLRQLEDAGIVVIPEAQVVEHDPVRELPSAFPAE